MWNKRILYTAIIICIVSIIFSCEKRKHSSYRIFISNQSTKEIIVEYSAFRNIDTIIMPYDISPGKHIVTLWNVEYLDEILPELSEKEFEEKLSSLKVFYMSDENEKIYIGGSEDYCRMFSNWVYRFSEDDGYGMHEYLLIVEDE